MSEANCDRCIEYGISCFRKVRGTPGRMINVNILDNEGSKTVVLETSEPIESCLVNLDEETILKHSKPLQYTAGTLNLFDKGLRS